MTAQPPLPDFDTPDVVDAAGWRCIDFLSDLHLQASESDTFNAWADHMAHTPAQAVFILGDLFEAWVGDDVLGAPSAVFERACLQVLQRSARRLSLFWLCGNRDFLTGSQLAKAVPWRALSDPCVLQLPSQRLLLSHGDLLCVEDHEYQVFRQEVRSPAWQQAFLARPLPERQAVAQHLRQQSMAKKASGVRYADADAGLSRQWLAQAQADVLLHGHTHLPGQHSLGEGLSRWVLSDWDLQAQPPRGEVLRWQAGHWQRVTVHPRPA
jgi:UDP-2,3-diacylglucosamine hydrolase